MAEWTKVIPRDREVPGSNPAQVDFFNLLFLRVLTTLEDFLGATECYKVTNDENTVPQRDSNTRPLEIRPAALTAKLQGT